MESRSLVFKALGDPTRRAILDRLREGDLSAGDIADGFEIGKASISHHLNLLKSAGLVRCRRQGQQQIYTLHTTVFQEALQWLMVFFEEQATPPRPTDEGKSGRNGPHG
ncbi:MAG TPA: autorepressor SdpR family transcription factor [Geothrix sp.]|nr:autorepressor SdpR family transcription factor [Geothrix sp.]